MIVRMTFGLPISIITLDTARDNGNASAAAVTLVIAINHFCCFSGFSSHARRNNCDLVPWRILIGES
jgi:hypothetical protein